MLRLKRATVVNAGPAGAMEQRLAIQVGGERRSAIADIGLVGASQPGDELVVNVEAVELGLGSGGFDVVHVNLSRGLDGEGTPRAHVMKLNYTSLQHAVSPVEEGDADATPDPPQLPIGRPVAVLALHGQLAPLAWAFAQARPGARLGYVQTAGGALPGGHSCVVRDLRDDGLLAGHLTAGPAFGGADGEAITTAAALHHGLTALGWDAAVAGPGPGILGSGSALGHGGLQALDSAHTALALGCPTLLVARMSSTDLRSRHRGLSHHTRTVLDLLLARVSVAVPAGEGIEGLDGAGEEGFAGPDDESAHKPPRVARAHRRPRRLPRHDPAVAVDGPRGPAVLRGRPRGRHRARRACGGRSAMSDERIESLGGETVFEGSQFSVRIERFRHEDGGVAEREIVRRTDAAGIVAYDDEHVWLVRQPREALAEYTLELPAGKLDVEGESPLQTAQRELAEEIGRDADAWEPITAFHPTTGYSDERVHLFAATGLRESDVEADPGERIEIVRWPLHDLDGAIAATTDAKTLLGLIWLRDRLHT